MEKCYIVMNAPPEINWLMNCVRSFIFNIIQYSQWHASRDFRRAEKKTSKSLERWKYGAFLLARILPVAISPCIDGSLIKHIFLPFNIQSDSIPPKKKIILNFTARNICKNQNRPSVLLVEFKLKRILYFTE